ncbi:hypothetical protein GGS20DRAFT_544597 [Poronia punctata]|nr:hypothetical protein GGS20DRAFT_544597 [Poronia punctata]
MQHVGQQRTCHMYEYLMYLLTYMYSWYHVYFERYPVDVASNSYQRSPTSKDILIDIQIPTSYVSHFSTLSFHTNTTLGQIITQGRFTALALPIGRLPGGEDNTARCADTTHGSLTQAPNRHCIESIVTVSVRVRLFVFSKTDYLLDIPCSGPP